MDVMLDTLTTLSAGTLVDAALNVVGFLAAGGFFLVISSMVRGRQGRKSTETVVDEKPAVAKAAAPAVEGRSSLSFVSLASERPGKKTEAKEASPTPTETAAESMRRNRAEVINLARKMIAARESREAIAGKLPISEAELSMLSEQ